MNLLDLLEEYAPAVSERFRQTPGWGSYYRKGNALRAKPSAFATGEQYGSRADVEALEEPLFSPVDLLDPEIGKAVILGAKGLSKLAAKDAGNALDDLIVRRDGGNMASMGPEMDARQLKAKILKSIRAASKEGHGAVGVRVFDEQHTPAHGEFLPDSFNWVDEVRIPDEPLGGVAVFDPMFLDDALAYSVGPGSKIGVVVGDGFVDHAMPEAGARVIYNGRLYGNALDRAPLEGVWDARGVRNRLKK